MGQKAIRVFRVKVGWYDIVRNCLLYVLMFDVCTKTLPSKSKFWKFYTNLLASSEFAIIKKVIIITKFSIILQTQAKMQRGKKTNLQPYSYLGLDLCVRMIHSQVR